MKVHDKLNYMAALTLLSWCYVGALVIVFWLAGMYDGRATIAALAAVTIFTCWYGDRTADKDVGIDETDEAGA